MVKELIDHAKEMRCTLPTQFVRELIADENTIINTYRQMSPEFKSMLFAMSTQLLDKQIELEMDESDISDDYLFYNISDANRFYEVCHFLLPSSYEEIVLAVQRDLKCITICGVDQGKIYTDDCEDDTDILLIMEYVYETIKSPADYDEQLRKRCNFEAVTRRLAERLFEIPEIY